MSNRDLLSQLGWPEELIAECEKTAASLTAGLPNTTCHLEEPRGLLAVSGNSVDLFIEPIATQSLYFVSSHGK